MGRTVSSLLTGAADMVVGGTGEVREEERRRRTRMLEDDLVSWSLSPSSSSPAHHDTMSITAESSTRPTVLDAAALVPTDPAAAETILKEIVGRVAGPKDDELLKEKEQAIIKLGELYRDRK